MSQQRSPTVPTTPLEQLLGLLVQTDLRQQGDCTADNRCACFAVQLFCDRMLQPGTQLLSSVGCLGQAAAVLCKVAAGLIADHQCVAHSGGAFAAVTSLFDRWVDCMMNAGRE